MAWIQEKTLSWIQKLCLNVVRCGKIPHHVAFIMDGNRRYARMSGMEKSEGHAKGFDKLAETLYWCLELGIPEVTVYAFSIENFKRTSDEVDALLELARKKFENLLSEKDKLMEHGVCIRVIGNISLLPADIRKSIAEAMTMTKDNNKAFLNVAFAYTACDDMCNSVRDVVSGVQHGELELEDVNECLLNDTLYTNNSAHPDLLIRTSGEVRLSDFLLWQISCSCIYFTNVLWPNFSFWHMLSAVLYYQCHYNYLSPLRLADGKLIDMRNHSGRTLSFVNEIKSKRFNEIEDVKHIVS